MAIGLIARRKLFLFNTLVWLIILYGLGSFCFAATQIDIVGPNGSTAFGRSVVYALPNGNIVIRDAQWSNNGLLRVGAVYLYNGATGTLISTLRGGAFWDEVGNGGVTVLPNGNFVVRSSLWSGTGVANDDFGAVTFCNGTTGCNGVVSVVNSLVGSQLGDEAGSGFVFALSNGNYLVRSPKWNNGSSVDVGALTFCSGNAGCTGPISAQNGLIGSTAGDRVGFDTPTDLANGHYLVSATSWSNAGNASAGALTFCSSETGCAGTISAANSLLGTSPFDRVGKFVTLLANGNYVASSDNWDNGGLVDVGFSKLCNGVTGCAGSVTTGNSLYGTTTNDAVGMFVYKLSNGNYTVSRSRWDNGTIPDVGAVTFCSGVTGCTGPVTTSNSAYGSSANDSVGQGGIFTNGNYVVEGNFRNGTTSNFGSVTFCSGDSGCTGPVTAANSLFGTTPGDSIADYPTIALANGNYVVQSSLWQDANNGKGAVTWCNGTVGCSGPVSTANSLVGDCTLNGGTANGACGLGVTALTNGNYVVQNAGWDDGPLRDVGAYTFCNGGTGCNGTANPSNSLVGSQAYDGYDGAGLLYGTIIPLTNGDYVVSVPPWDNGTAFDAGAAALCSGQVGCQGRISEQNSLVGSSAGDRAGRGVVELSNGNYVLGSIQWDNGSIADVGAVTWCPRLIGCTGTITAANSLIGNVVSDTIGDEIVPSSNGNYYIKSLRWNNGSIVDAGAVTIGDGSVGTVGAINAGNSVRGLVNSINFGATAIDYVNNQLVVGHGNDRASLLRPFSSATPTPTPAGLEGDVAPRPDGDGAMLSTDITQLRRFVSGLDVPGTTTNEIQRADCAPRSTFGDGVLTSTDVVQGRRYVAGLDPSTPSGGPASRSFVPDSVFMATRDSAFEPFKRELSIGEPVRRSSAITVPVELTSLGDEVAMSFTIEYDSNLLTNPRLSLGKFAPSGSTLTFNAGKSGLIGILIDSPVPMTLSAGPVTMITITFDMNGEGQKPTISLTGALTPLSVSNGAAEALPVRYHSGSARN